MSDSKKSDSLSTNSDNLSLTTSSTTYLPVPNTPTQKGKVKTPRYLRNASVKLLTHPVDKNIAWSFFLSVIFAAISVVTGFPTVMMLMWILGTALGLRIFFAGCCSYRRNTRVRDVEEAMPENPRRSSSWLNSDNFVRPPEALWLHDTSFNLHISHCLFFLDSGLNSAKLQEIVRTRVLNKTTEEGAIAFPRFSQKVVPVCSGYCWVDDEDFSIENHIYDESKEVRTAQNLEEHISSLMSEPLPMSKPLWEIRLIKDFGRCKDTVLIVRIHQAVSDAITLILILCNYLSDNQQFLRLKTRFGSATFFLNLFRALFVAPLTFLGWLLFKPRDYNFFNRRHKPQSRVVAWSHNIKYSKVLRIKQVMRCSLNDVFVSAVSGAVRAYFTRNGICNPPNVTAFFSRQLPYQIYPFSLRILESNVYFTLTIPVDLRQETSNSSSIPDMGCKFSQVHVRLPSNTEGAIPRLWDVRRRMEELKTSPDTVVMYGAIYCLLPILPEVLAQWILNTVLRKASVVLANVPGPEEMLMLGSKPLKKITFWMSPRPEIPVVFSIISYAGTIQMSISADKSIVPQPQVLVQEFSNEINRLSHLLARRRIPGEHRRRSHFTEERRIVEILNPPDGELQQKLHAVQEEIHRVTMQINSLKAVENPPGMHRLSDGKLMQKLDELKEEFSELMRELRRRKSLADGIVVNSQDEDMDGELRRPRRLTLTGGRRSSLSQVLASTTRPLATPTISHHSFVVSTPNLQSAGSPTSSQQRPSFLQVAQERFGRRKSDFS